MAAKALTGEEYTKALLSAARTGVIPGGLNSEDAANIRGTIANPANRQQVIRSLTQPKVKTTIAQSTKLERSPKNTPVQTTNVKSKTETTSSPQIKPSNEQQPQLELNTNTSNRNITSKGTAKTQVFDINSFRSEIATNDVLPAHSFLVTFSPFRSNFSENVPLTNFVLNKRNTLVLRCESVTIPTPTLLKDEDIRRYGYGPVEKVGYGVQFGDVSMTWVVDNKAEIIDFMYQWMNTIVSHDSPSMDASTDITGIRPGLGGYSPFEVGYKDAYTNPIVRVYIYNRQNQTVTEYEMYDVFPQNIQPISMAWANENEIQKLNVTFSYTTMRMKAPLKTTEEQLNYLLEGRINPIEERIQTRDKGGDAARDKSESPIGEAFASTTNAFKPNANESQLTLNTVGTTVPQITVRTFNA